MSSRLLSPRLPALLLALAGACALVGGVYANPYLIQAWTGRLPPDMQASAVDVSPGFQAGAVLWVGWMMLVVLLSDPRASRWLRERADSVRPSAVWGAVVGFAAAYAVARMLVNAPSMRAPLEALASGTAEVPFQYRALVPWLVEGVHRALGMGPSAYLGLYAGAEMLAAVAVYVAFREFLRRVDSTASAADLLALWGFVPLTLGLATPYRYNVPYFPYDTPSVAFFTAGLAFLVAAPDRRRWGLFYLLFVAATLNRETSCFLAFAYIAFALGREPVRRIAGHTALMAVVWVGVKAALVWIYRDAPTASTELGLFWNQLPRSAAILGSGVGPLYIASVALGGAGVVAVACRRALPVPLRRLGWVAVPFLLGMAVVGELLEVRIYSEMVPLAAAGVALGFRQLAREAAAAEPASVPIPEGA